MSSANNQTIRVKVPASSANLGPGFDCLSLALSCYDEIVLTSATNTEIRVEGIGKGVIPETPANLVYKALAYTFDYLNLELPTFSLVCNNHIPQGKGLGSSAAAAVAGVVAANAYIANNYSGLALTNSELLQLVCKFEGHADNAAASFLGGIVMAWRQADPTKSQYCANNISFNEDIEPVLFIPNIESKTNVARSLLPREIDYSDAVFNISRTALLVAALINRVDLLFVATEDKLHQNYRKTSMPNSFELLTKLREKHLPAVISGAGPAVLVFKTTSWSVSTEQVVLELAKEFGFSMHFLQIAAGVEVKVT